MYVLKGESETILSDIEYKSRYNYFVFTCRFVNH